MDMTIKRLPQGARFLPATRLATTLLSLGVMPFDPKDVDGYKAAQLAACKSPSFWWRHRNVVRSTVALTLLSALFIMVAGVIALGIGAVWAFVALFTGYSEVATTMTFVGASAFLGGFALEVLCFRTDKIIVRGPAEWKRVSLAEYLASGKDIPSEAHQAVEAIRREHPTMTFFAVDELLQGREKLDPFLVVYAGVELEFYIYQWNKPLFKQP